MRKVPKIRHLYAFLRPLLRLATRLHSFGNPKPFSPEWYLSTTMSTSQEPSSPSRRRRTRVPAGVSLIQVEQFHRRLEACYGGPIDLSVNDNTSTLLSMRRPPGGGPVRFSVHHMFLQATDEVLGALAQYLRRPTPNSQRTLRAYMDARSTDIRPNRIAPRVLTLRARGHTYDLHRLAGEVNRDFFDGKLQVYITWSRGAVRPSGRRRHIIFGSWDHRTRLIRIHPALDDPEVPEYFVRFVIYHEMLHALLDPPRTGTGRRCVHTAEFRRLEERFPWYKQCMEWEQEFMSRR